LAQRVDPTSASIVNLRQLHAIRCGIGYAAIDSGRNSPRRELFFGLAIVIAHRLPAAHAINAASDDGSTRRNDACTGVTGCA
jgi:hypothetical protein